MNELVREIEEDMRRERAQRLWSRFGRMLVWASVGVIAVTAAIVLWQDHKRSQAAVQTAQFIRGINRLGVEDYKGAIEVFDALTKNENSPYYGMAMLRKAQAQAALGKKEEAVKTYQTLAKRKGLFSDLAKVLAGAPERPDRSSPFYYTQSEAIAWQLAGQGKTGEAADILAALAADEKTPTSQRERVSQALHYLAPGKKALSDE